MIRLFANLYDVDENDYRLAEWTFLYFTIAELKSLLQKDMLYEYTCQRISYIGESDERTAYEIYNDGYFEKAEELDISKVESDTPIGNYWFDAECDEMK